MSYLESLFSLQGKTAVVIGGAEVVLVGRNEAKAGERLEAITAAGGKGRFVPADVSSAAGIEAAVINLAREWARTTSGAGSFITGTEIIVDGGFAAMTIQRKNKCQKQISA